MRSTARLTGICLLVVSFTASAPARRTHAAPSNNPAVHGDLVPTITTLYMRNTGSGGHLFLSYEAGSDYTGAHYGVGGPLPELYHAGVPLRDPVRVYRTQEENDEPFSEVLDATRDVTGNVTVVAPRESFRMGAGQVRVVTTVMATLMNGGPVTLGSHDSRVLVDPTNSAETNFPFTIGIPDTLDEQEIGELRVDVDIRGWSVLTGWHRLDGQSYVDLPTYSEEES